MDGRSLLRKFNVLDTRPPDNENGLVGWWTYDDGTATDFSGNQNNGAPSSPAPYPADGKIGGALKFVAASSTFFTVTNGALFGTGAGQKFTLALWFNPTTISNYDTFFITGEASGANSAFILGLFSTAAYYIDTWTTDYEPAATIPLGQWTHVAVTADGTSFRLYHNGLLINTTAKNPSFISATTYLGQTGQFGGRIFNGVMDDVRAYRRTLGPDEVYALYAQGLSYGQGQPEGEMPALKTAAGATFLAAWATGRNRTFDGVAT